MLLAVLALPATGQENHPGGATSPRSDQNAGESGAAKSGELAPDTGGTNGANARAIEGTGSGTVSLSAGQRQQLRDYVRSSGMPRTDTVRFTVSIGASVPRQADLRPLPKKASDILHAYQGSLYVLLRDQLVLVEPVNRRIAAIIPHAG